MDKKQRGLSLIELIVFIIILGISMGGLFLGVNQVLYGISSTYKLTRATFLANARMEVILYRRAFTGYSGLVDPCSTTNPAICTPLATYATNNGLSVSSSITSSGSTSTITVQITGQGNVTLVTVVSNY